MSNRRKWLPFEEARELVRGLELKNVKEYRCCYFDLNLPCDPYKIYGKDWISWYDWMGRESPQEFLPFDEAKVSIRNDMEKYGVNSYRRWRKYCSSGNKPKNIPSSPIETYKNKGWVSWSDWLKTNNTRGCFRKYHVNENFFKTWSHDMAYILGFWFADGCIVDNKNSKTFCLTQHKNEKYILEEILLKMQSNHLIKPIRNCFDFKIGSKKIFDDIILLGGKPHKSMDMEFPNIPEDYLHDFIRGYFDGDGCVYYNRDSNKGLCTFVSGSMKFIKKLNEILSGELPKYNNGVKINYGGKIQIIKERMAWINSKYCKFRENYRLALSKNDSRRLRDFIYQDTNCIKIKRKYEKLYLLGNIRQIGGRVLGSKNKSHKIT